MKLQPKLTVLKYNQAVTLSTAAMRFNLFTADCRVEKGKGVLLLCGFA